MQQQLVHGGQLVIERDDNERTTDLVAMYIPGYRFNPVWSALLMVGARIPLSGSGNETEDTRFVFNGSVFAETSASWTWGLELNFRADIDRSEKLVVVPQVHWQSTGGFGIQGGLGLRHENSSYKTEYIARVIYGF